MRRFLSCFLSAVLVVGLMPELGFANAAVGSSGADALDASPTNVGLRAQDLAADAVGPADASFADANLYAAVVAQLDEAAIEYAADASNRRIALDAENNARFTTLNLNNKNIKSVKGLGAFTGLAYLDLSHNLVSETAEFSTLANLEHLDLYDNAVHDFSGLATLSKLTYLDLGENNEIAKGALSGLDALGQLAALEYLDFSENYAPNICDELGGLANLEFLNLQQNNIVDVSGLASLSKLKTLILSHNLVTSIEPLLGLRADDGESGSTGEASGGSGGNGGADAGGNGGANPDSAASGLVALEELNLQSNKLYENGGSGIDGLVNDEGELALPNLKSLDIWDNTNWNGFLGNGSRANTDKLYALLKAGKLVFNYEYDRVKGFDTSNLPREDGDVRYVTYDDFDAYRDGVHDDYNAMRNAHRFANLKGCEVRATPGEPYHIFRTWDKGYNNVYTNTDWQGATFIVHDEEIDRRGARFAPLLCFRSSPAGATEATSTFKNIVTLENPSWSVTKETTSLSAELADTLAPLNKKGYERYYVMVYNADRRHYVRFGQNANGGSEQWDGFVVDATGALKGPVQWDFDKVTKAIITPIPTKQSYVKNGHFVVNPVASKTEAPYQRGGGKPIYYQRNLQIRDCANVQIASVTQTVGTEEGGFDNGELSGSYTGFFEVRSCADVDMRDCAAWARRYDMDGRSTYGITLNTNTNIALTNVNCSNPWEQQLDVGGRWGIMGANHCKHVLFDHCTLNRIDAHEGFYDMMARDCTLGGWGFRLIGQGPLTIERCDVHALTFIMLRYDYGSTWDGEARIIDCTHHVSGTQSQGLFALSPSFESDGSVHDFGYELHFPNLYVENLTVDERDWANGKYEYYIVPNHEYNKANTGLPASYWPDSVEVNGIDFVNYEDTMGFEPAFRLVSTEAGTIADKLSGYSVQGVKFSGVGRYANFEDVDATDLLLGEERTISASGATDAGKYATFDVNPEQLVGKDVVVEFAGTQPRLALMDANWKGWALIDAYYCDPERNLAYFSADAIAARWAATRAGDANVGDVGKLRLLSAGETTLSRVALAGNCAHNHEWGTWEVTTPATCEAPGAEERACTHDSRHVETRTTDPLGHKWGAWEVTLPATVTREGERTRSCSRCEAIEKEVIARLEESTSGGGATGGTSGGATDSGSGGGATAGGGTSGGGATGGKPSASSGSSSTPSASSPAKTPVSTKTTSSSATRRKKPAKQKIAAKNVSKTLKASKKTRKLAKKRTLNIRKLAKVRAKTTVRFAKANKAGGRLVKVSTSGKLTLKKGLKRGTYKVKVKLKAKKTTKYKSATKTITVKIRIR